MTDLRPAVFVPLTVFSLVTMLAPPVTGGDLPPSFVPHLELSYTDPQSGKLVSCAEGCRRFEVPDKVELAIRIKVENNSRDEWGEGVAWDLWFDQRQHPVPGIESEDELIRKPSGRPLEELGLLDRPGADDGLGHARLEVGVDGGFITDTAAELNLQLRVCLSDVVDDTCIDRLACECTVKVDDV